MLQSLSGMYLSIAYFHPASSRTRIEDIWTEIGSAALLGAPDVPIDVGRSEPGTHTGTRQVSRREGILSEAIVLFREHGFGGVSVDEIGAAAGVAGPALYRYFENKAELLAAAMSRASEQLSAGVSTALAMPDDAASLGALIDSYVRIAIAQSDTIAVYLAEVDSLPADRRDIVRREQRAYVEEWCAVVRRLAPQQSSADVRVAVHGTIGMANGYAQGTVRPPSDISELVLHGMMSAGMARFVGSR